MSVQAAIAAQAQHMKDLMSVISPGAGHSSAFPRATDAPAASAAAGSSGGGTEGQDDGAEKVAGAPSGELTSSGEGKQVPGGEAGEDGVLK